MPSSLPNPGARTRTTGGSTHGGPVTGTATVVGAARFALSFPPASKPPSAPESDGGASTGTTSKSATSAPTGTAGSGSRGTGPSGVDQALGLLLVVGIAAAVVVVWRKARARGRRRDEKRERDSAPVVPADFPPSATPGPRVVHRLVHPASSTPTVLVHPGAPPPPRPGTASPGQPAPEAGQTVAPAAGAQGDQAAAPQPTPAAALSDLGTIGDEPRPAPPAAEEAPLVVEVGVLGPVQVRGVREVPRARLVELLVCLTVQERPLTLDELRAMLWAGAPAEAKEKSLRSYVSTLRTCLPPGALPDAAEAGGYCVSDAVTTDWDRFRELVSLAATTADAAGRAEALRCALQLVRGTPFSGVVPGTYTWAWAGDRLASQMEVAVFDAARQLAATALEDGQHELAHWATTKGLLAAPYDERLWADLFTAAAGLGTAELERARRDATSVLGELSPELSATYARLCERRLPPAAAG